MKRVLTFFFLSALMTTFAMAVGENVNPEECERSRESTTRYNPKANSGSSVQTKQIKSKAQSI